VYSFYAFDVTHFLASTAHKYVPCRITRV